jgi:hypothetical protein
MTVLLCSGCRPRQHNPNAAETAASTKTRDPKQKTPRSADRRAFKILPKAAGGLRPYGDSLKPQKGERKSKAKPHIALHDAHSRSAEQQKVNRNASFSPATSLETPIIGGPGNQCMLHLLIMTNGTAILKGTIHGKTIALDREPGYPDGQAVSVTVIPSLPSGEGLKRAFGAWADESAEVDRHFDRVRQDRKHQRAEPMP